MFLQYYHLRELVADNARIGRCMLIIIDEAQNLTGCSLARLRVVGL